MIPLSLKVGDNRPRSHRNIKRSTRTASPTKLTVDEERITNQQVAVNNMDDGAIAFYVNAKVVSDKVKDALQDVVKRKAARGRRVLLTAERSQGA